MSRAYRISISESVRRHISVADGLATRLEILEVLPAPALCDLLARELADRGFVREGEIMIRHEDDGTEVAIAVEGSSAGQVTVRLRRDAQVDISVERSRQTYEETEDGTRAALRTEVERAVGEHEKQAHTELGAQVTQALERKLRDLGRELDQISSRVTAEALKVRAGQLGEIQEISEDPQTGSLTIKVKV